MKVVLKILLVILIASAIGLTLWYFYADDLIGQNNIVNEDINVLVNNEPIVNEPKVEPVPEVTPEDLIRVASFSFASRFGSYSNDTRWQNIKDIYNLLTPNYQSAMDYLIQSTPAQVGYYSVSTKPLFLTIHNQAGSAASVTVKTQKEEVFQINGEAQITYQDINVSLLKIGSEWKIDSAQWVK